MVSRALATVYLAALRLGLAVAFLPGATEEIGVTLVRGNEWLARPGTVGRGFLTQICILDDAGSLIPPGTAGTVFMRPRSGLPWPCRGLAAGPLSREWCDPAMNQL
jgi:hypothetical protein